MPRLQLCYRAQLERLDRVYSSLRNKLTQAKAERLIDIRATVRDAGDYGEELV
jgi:hypothetical protein